MCAGVGSVGDQLGREGGEVYIRRDAESVGGADCGVTLLSVEWVNRDEPLPSCGCGEEASLHCSLADEQARWWMAVDSRSPGAGAGRWCWWSTG